MDNTEHEPSGIIVENLEDNHPVDGVLFGGLEAHLEEVVIAGKTHDGEWYFASSSREPQAVMYIVKTLEKCIESHM